MDDISTLSQTFAQWASVGLGGSPNINGLKSSWEINAGVVWTLKYEWLFYVSLPFFAILTLAKTKARILIISTLLIITLVKIIPMSEFRISFAFFGGIIAAYASHSIRIREICQGRIAALLFFSCIGNVLFSHRNAAGSISLILLTVAFVIVACENDLFGILSLDSVRSFGDIGYSAYLLHGLLLYLAFHTENVVPFDGSLTPVQHWSTVAGLAIILVVICRLTFKFIELPAMEAAPVVHAWIRKLNSRRKGAASIA